MGYRIHEYFKWYFRLVYELKIREPRRGLWEGLVSRDSDNTERGQVSFSS